MLEVPPHKCCGVDNELPLAGLGRGVVDLEHAQAEASQAQRARIEAGPEQDQLASP